VASRRRAGPAVAATLLESRLGLYRTPDDSPVVAREPLNHRGVPCRGWVEGRRSFLAGYIRIAARGRDGACRDISQTPGDDISKALRIATFPAIETIGLIWNSLEQRADRTLSVISRLDETRISSRSSRLHRHCGSPGPMRGFHRPLAHLAWVHDQTCAYFETNPLSRP